MKITQGQNILKTDNELQNELQKEVNEQQTIPQYTKVSNCSLSASSS